MSRLLAAFFLLLTASFAQTGVPNLWQRKAVGRLEALDAALDGVLGAAAIDLTNGSVLSYHGDSQFPTASSIKIAVMIGMFRDAHAGRLRFSDTIELPWVGHNDDSEGPLRLRLMKGPVRITTGEAVEAMMQWSDNSAANHCIETVGMDRVNALVRELGLRDTHLRRLMMDVAAASAGRENVSTPLDLARLMQAIYENKAADPDSCRRMLDLMKRVHQPYMGPAMPPGVELAAKPGSLDGVKCEAGIVFLKNRPFAVTVMSTYLAPGLNPVPDAARVIVQYFSRLAVSNEWGRRLD